LILPGLVLASATSSAALFALTDGCVTSAMLAIASGATGAKSLIGSYGIFLKRLRFSTIVLAVISSV
jgi:hypothetical protein